MNEMFVYRNWYIVIISHDHDNSYNDGFVINIPKVIIADISNSITVTYLFYFHSFCNSFLTGEITKTEGQPMTKKTSTDICTSYPDHIPLALRIYLGG